MNIRDRMRELADARTRRRRGLSEWGRNILRRNILAGIFSVAVYIAGSLIALWLLRR